MAAGSGPERCLGECLTTKSDGGAKPFVSWLLTRPRVEPTVVPTFKFAFEGDVPESFTENVTRARDVHHNRLRWL
jgi:hypothetical protein